MEILIHFKCGHLTFLKHTYSIFIKHTSTLQIQQLVLQLIQHVDLDGRDQSVSNAFLILVANMDNVISHGSAIVKRDGVDYIVTKVITLLAELNTVNIEK